MSMAADEVLRLKRASFETSMIDRPDADGVSRTPGELDSVPVLWFRPGSAQPDAVLLYFHGGGFRMGSPTAIAPFLSHLAAELEVQIVAVDYRLAPENPFPAALTDGIAALKALPGLGYRPGRVVIGGDSAGGGLAASVLLWAVKEGLPPLAGGIFFSPWADLRVSADSYAQCRESDALFSAESATEGASMYLAGADPADPAVSPALADWRGAPRLIVQNSRSEVLRDDSRLLVQNARSAGVGVFHQEFENMPHVFHYGFPELPEARRAVSAVRHFIADALDIART